MLTLGVIIYWWYMLPYIYIAYMDPMGNGKERPKRCFLGMKSAFIDPIMSVILTHTIPTARVSASFQWANMAIENLWTILTIHHCVYLIYIYISYIIYILYWYITSIYIYIGGSDLRQHILSQDHPTFADPSLDP